MAASLHCQPVVADTLQQGPPWPNLFQCSLHTLVLPFFLQTDGYAQCSCLNADREGKMQGCWGSSGFCAHLTPAAIWLPELQQTATVPNQCNNGTMQLP